MPNENMLKCTVKKSWSVAKLARDLTKEDWKSSTADISAAFALTALAVFALAALGITTANPLGYSGMFVITVFTLAALGIAPLPVFALTVLTIATLIAFTLTALAAFAAFTLANSVDHTTIWYYMFRFPGAVWYHYHKKQE